MKPHLRRYFIAKSVGWGWGIYATRTATMPITSCLSFRTACGLAEHLSNGGLPYYEQI